MPSNHSLFPDRFLNWQSSSPGAVRRPFTDRGTRPLGADKVLKTGLVRKLEEIAKKLIRPEVKPKGIFLVGGAGNGKSDALEQFLLQLAGRAHDPDSSKTALGKIFSQKKRKLSIEVSSDLNGLKIGFDKITIVQDATEGDGSNKNAGCLLLEDLAEIENGQNLLVCCINRGILEAARQEAIRHGGSKHKAAKEFLDTCTNVIDPLAYGKPCWPTDEGHYIWPLDLESLVGECAEPVILQMLEVCTDGNACWESSVTDEADKSAISYNRIFLDNEAKRKNFANLLHVFEVLSGERWSFRDLFSLLAHLLTGGFLRKEDESAIEAAARLKLPQNAAPQRTIEDTCNAVRATIPQLLFPKWPGHGELQKEVKALGLEGGDTTLANLLKYLEKNPLQEPRLPVEKTIRGAWSNALDPALGLDDCEIDVSGNKITERELEDAFALSLSRGTAKIKDALGQIENKFLELLVGAEHEIAKYLETNSQPQFQKSAQSVNRWLRKLAIMVVKRFLGFTYGHAYQSKDVLTYYEKINDVEFLKERCSILANLLGPRELTVELNLGLCQPRGGFGEQGMLLKTSLPRIREKPIPAKPEVRPGFAAANLSFEYGRDSQPVEIPFTFQLFKRLQAHKSYLIPGCLNPMTRGFIDQYRIRLDGMAVRSDQRITIQTGDGEEYFSGYSDEIKD